MVPQKHGVFGTAPLRALKRATRARAWCQVCVWLLTTSLLLSWNSGVKAASPPCEDGFLQFFYQMYRQGSYCTCQMAHEEPVTEKGSIRHEGRYTLPDIPVQQFGSFLDLSQVRARFWATIVRGPGGLYNGVIRMHEDGHETTGLVRQIEQLSEGQEIEITAEKEKGILLRPNASYQVIVEGQNPELRPQQALALQGRACFYLVSR